MKMKVIPTTILGSITSGIILGVSAMIIVIVEDTTGTFGLRSRDFWWLAFILGAMVGFVGGGIEGFVISYFRFSFLSTFLFGIGFSLIALCFYFFGTRGAWDSNLQRFLEVFVVWQAIYPVSVALISANSNILD